MSLHLLLFSQYIAFRYIPLLNSTYIPLLNSNTSRTFINVRHFEVTTIHISLLGEKTNEEVCQLEGIVSTDNKLKDASPVWPRPETRALYASL